MVARPGVVGCFQLYVGPRSTVEVYSARDREVAGSNPPAVLPVLCIISN